MGESFPEVEGGGSLILAWQVKGRKVLVVGGGEVRYIYWAVHDALSCSHCSNRSQLVAS